jgi:UDP-N-acetylglucosamine 2-epimerase (non-hydrolysing)
MERPEALETGSVVMSGIEQSQVLEALRIVEQIRDSEVHPSEYGYPDVSSRLVKVLVSTVHRNAFWTGLRPIDVSEN